MRSVLIYHENRILMPYLAVNCKWGSYGAWTECTVTCGGGSQTRTRTVETPAANGGADCVGDSSQTRHCSITACLTSTYNMLLLRKLYLRL